MGSIGTCYRHIDVFIHSEFFCESSYRGYCLTVECRYRL